MKTIPDRVSSNTPPHHLLNYGRGYIIEWCGAFFRQQNRDAYMVLDIGCGSGQDLQNIRNATPLQVTLYGIEIHEPTIRACEGSNITVFPVDIEKEQIPVRDHFFDIIILNQVLEHTKEIFFIFSEISRVLKPEGILIVGVPNLASFHNRLLLLLGRHPTNIETLGPHVRGFTIPALKKFIEADGYFKVIELRGSNFYPFPPVISSGLIRIFRGGSASIFFLIKKTEREGLFIEVLKDMSLETNYFTGTRDKLLKAHK